MTETLREDTDWDPDTKTEREVDHWKIINRRTGSVVGKAKTKTGKRKAIDNHDNKYGAYAHHAKPVWKEETVHSEELLIAEGQTHTVAVRYSDPKDRTYKVHPEDHTAFKSRPSKVYDQHIHVTASSKTQAINKVGVHLHNKGYKVHDMKHVGLKEEVDIMEEDKFAPRKLKTIVSKPAKKYHEYKGNTPDEKAIVAKYDDNTVHHPDRNGNGDDVFKASKLSRDEKAVEPGEDEKKYNEWNNGANKVSEAKDPLERFNHHSDKASEYKVKKFGAKGAGDIENAAKHAEKEEKHKALALAIHKKYKLGN